MTTPHRATPDQWHNIDQYRKVTRAPDHLSITLELADRLAAAEQRIGELEGNHPVKPDSSAPEPPDLTVSLLQHPGEDDIAYSQRVYRAGWDAAMAAANAKPTSNQVQTRSSTPAGSLVERVAEMIGSGDDFQHWGDEARAAILAVADWLGNQGMYANRAAAGYLRQEVERHG